MKNIILYILLLFSITASAQNGVNRIFGGTVNDVSTLAKSVGTSGVPVTVGQLSWFGETAQRKFVWNDTSTKTPVVGMIIQVPGITTGRWFADYSQADAILLEWFGADTTNSASTLLSTAINFSQSVGMKLSTKMPVIKLASKVQLNLNTNIDFRDAQIKPHSTFPSGDTMITISRQVGAGTNFTPFQWNKWHINGAGREDIVGIAFKGVDAENNESRVTLENIGTGLVVTGNTEKQKIIVDGVNVTELVRIQIDSANLNTPDENHYEITGHLCGTYFHKVSGQTSDIVFFKTENSRDTNRYAVIIEGGKMTQISGEIRGQNGGSVYVNGSPTNDLNIEFKGLHIHQTYGGSPLYVKNARSLNGNVIIERMRYNATNTTNGFPAYIGNITGGGVFAMSIQDAIVDSSVIILGSPGKSEAVRNMNLTINASPINIGTYAVETRNVFNTTINLTSNKGILFDSTISSLTVNIGSDFISGSLPIVNYSTSYPSIKIGGGLTSTTLNAYAYPVKGMVAMNVTDKGGIGYYNSTSNIWYYTGDYFNNAFLGSATQRYGIGSGISTGGSSLAIGPNAYKSNGSGSSILAMGLEVMQNATTGSDNTGIGMKAMDSTTTASGNTAVGARALFTNTTGSSTVAVGVDALRSNQTGNQVAAGGYQAFYNSTANAGAGWGYKVLYMNTTGTNNVALGPMAGYNNVTGSNNIMIGPRNMGISWNLSNMLNIGNVFTATGVNTDSTFNVSNITVAIGKLATANSAILDLSATTTKGFLLPKLTTTQQNAISSPIAGLMIWNIDSIGVMTYSGSSWVKLGSGSGGTSLPSQTGNGGKFLTTDGSSASWAIAPNLANTDLTATANRTHNFASHDLKIDSLANLRFYNLNSGNSNYTKDDRLPGVIQINTLYAANDIIGHFNMGGNTDKTIVLSAGNVAGTAGSSIRLNSQNKGVIITHLSTTNADSVFVPDGDTLKTMALTPVNSAFFSSISDMQSYSGKAIYSIISGVGGSAIYYYDSTSSATPNGTTVVNGDGKGGCCWLTAPLPTYMVQDLDSMQNATVYKQDSIGGAGNNLYATASYVASHGGSVTPAAITKTDDTNITLTIGGSPTTAVLQAISLTMGWNGLLVGSRGGTGVDNGTKTITLGGNLTTSGAFNTTLTTTATTSVILPTTGTLATLAGTETLSGKTFSQDIALSAANTYNLATSSNEAANVYTRNVNSSTNLNFKSGTSSSSLNFSVNANKMVQISGTTGNVIIQSAGTYTDNGARLQVTGNTSGAVTTSSASTLTLDATALYWVFTGTTTTWTLPAVASHTGWTLFIKNRGSGNMTLQRAGSDNLYDTTTQTSITVAAGDPLLRVFCDGTYWIVK